MAEDKQKQLITKYLADQIGLLGHVYQAVDKQVKETKGDDDLNPVVVQISETMQAHQKNLTTRLEALGGQPTSPLKELGASVLGVAAGAIDAVRTEKVSKDLRDDYTALSLVNISYVMLITTAVATNDDQTAQLAASNLKETASLVSELGKVISYAVVKDLSDFTDLNPQAVQQGQKYYSQAWQQHGANNGNVGKGGNSGSGGGAGNAAKTSQSGKQS